jgi:ParB family chromosome partitioning protein
MATAIQKIVLSSSRDIPFNMLVLSQANVRRVKAGVSIEELAEDIARRTLLQSLSVRPVLDAEGAETGMYEVPAGGRRYRALDLLVKQKRLAKTAPVPCVVRTADDISAAEDSLAENVQRAGLHPLDQFRAFLTFKEQGLDDEEIAARFFVPVSVVKQRLRLASVSPKLHEVYAQDGMTLDQLMAFTVTNDTARQEQVWESLAHSYNKEPYQIRRQLTEGAVRATDKRAQFVGMEAYEAAGGVVLRDLFQSDDGGWLQDPALLDRLVVEKLKAEGERLALEGWRWIEVAPGFPYGHTKGLRRLEGAMAELTDEERTTYDALHEEFERLEVQYAEADELPEEADQRLGEIETALEGFDSRPAIFDSAEIARAGVFVSIDADGDLCVERGYVRLEDEAPAVDESDQPDGESETVGSADSGASADPVQRAVITLGGDAAAPDPAEEEDEILRPLPDRLVMELTAHRTLALRDALGDDPATAFAAVLHTFVLAAFYRLSSSVSCLDIALREPSFPAEPPGLKQSASARSIATRHADWKARLPKSEDDLWAALIQLTGDEQARLFAHCAASSVNALYERADRYGGPGISAHGLRRRLDHADLLARAVGLDMVAAGWKPTVDTYLGRVTKPRILEAVREGRGEREAQLIDHLKKGDMATEAERLLDGAGWLPEPLRLAAVDEPASEIDQAGEADTLPAFLDDGESGAEDDEAEIEPHVIAAE